MVGTIAVVVAAAVVVVGAAVVVVGAGVVVVVGAAVVVVGAGVVVVVGSAVVVVGAGVVVVVGSAVVVVGAGVVVVVGAAVVVVGAAVVVVSMQHSVSLQGPAPPLHRVEFGAGVPEVHMNPSQVWRQQNALVQVPGGPHSTACQARFFWKRPLRMHLPRCMGLRAAFGCAGTQEIALLRVAGAGATQN